VHQFAQRDGRSSLRTRTQAEGQSGASRGACGVPHRRCRGRAPAAAPTPAHPPLPQRTRALSQRATPEAPQRPWLRLPSGCTAAARRVRFCLVSCPCPATHAHMARMARIAARKAALHRWLRVTCPARSRAEGKKKHRTYLRYWLDSNGHRQYTVCAGACSRTSMRRVGCERWRCMGLGVGMVCLLTAMPPYR